MVLRAHKFEGRAAHRTVYIILYTDLVLWKLTVAVAMSEVLTSVWRTSPPSPVHHHWQPERLGLEAALELQRQGMNNTAEHISFLTFLALYC